MRNARSVSVFRSLQIIDRPYRAYRLHGYQYDLLGMYNVRFHMHCMHDFIILAMLIMQCLNKTEEIQEVVYEMHMEFCGHCSVMRFSTADSAKLPFAR